MYRDSRTDDERTERPPNRRAKRRVSRRRYIQGLGTAGAATAFSGVVGSAAAQGQTTVQWAADQLAADNIDAIRTALYEAGLSQDIQVEVLAGAWETGQRQNQYQQWLSAGRQQPDLLNMDSGWSMPFIVRDQVLNLSEPLSDDLLQSIEDEYQPFAVQSATGPDGELYGVPLFIGVGTIQYRKDLVEDAGYDPEGENWATEPLSWQRFSEVTRDVLDQNQDVDYGFTFQAQAYEGLACCNFNEWISTWGGAYFGAPEENLFGPVGERPITLDEQPVVDATRMIRTFIQGTDDSAALDGYAGNIAPSAVLQWSEEPSRRPFTNGNAVMHRNWPYSIEINGAEDQYGEDLGVMPVPYGVTPDEAEYPSTGGTVSALGGWNLTVNPNSQNQEAALEVLRAFTADSVQLALFQNVGWLPPKTELLASQQAQDVPTLGRYVDTIQVGAENALPRPVTVVWSQESSQISQAVNGVLSGSRQPEPAMSQLASAIEQIEQSV